MTKCINCVKYAENKPDYAVFSTVIKIDKNAFGTYWATVKQKELQSLTHVFTDFDICLIFLWYFLTSISSFAQFFYSRLAHFACRIGHVQYINILTCLRGFRDKLLYLVLSSLYPRLFWKLWDKRNFENLQLCPESLGANNIDISGLFIVVVVECL